MDKFQSLVSFIKSMYPGQSPVPLHAPVFAGNEKKYLADCIDSTFVSYIGKYVTQFEKLTADFTGAKYAIAMVNGTSAIQVALQVAGVRPKDEVITQALTFVATANAVSHVGARPVFVDVDIDTMGMSPEALEKWLELNVKKDSITGVPFNRNTNNKISAILPMHTFGHPCRINEIGKIAGRYNIPVIEDSAESLGSFYSGKHTGRFGLAGVFSYNGNKTITTGGGGMVITDDEEFARKAKHITTTAKKNHPWEFDHDEIGWNYRMPNINAAIGVAQMEEIDFYLQEKRETALRYQEFCRELGFNFVVEPKNSLSNYWLNAIVANTSDERDHLLKFLNEHGVFARPVWRLINELEMYKDCQQDSLNNSRFLGSRLVNLPSGVVRRA